MCSKPNARKRTIKTKIDDFEQVIKKKTCMKSILKRKKLETSKPNYY